MCADKSEATSCEPIAIIGMSCRFAPDIADLEAYWQFLATGDCAVGEIPEERWREYRNAGGKTLSALEKATRYGCFMNRIDQFDPGFFGISAREAESIDPQQRMILELAWEALEHAGICPGSLAGSDSGVFAAADSFDYGLQMFSDLTHIEPWALNGGMLFGIANRLSYTLDLHGPSLVVDTACAGSLTALHLGCQSLRDNTTSLAMIAAVNIMSCPGTTLALDASGATAADGRSKAFDREANGYGRGEGAGVLILKRLSDAVRDGDAILAVIRNSGVFQDGRTAGMMAPNGEAQELMLRQIYRQAAIPVDTIQYVEAHGTGTQLGDKEELSALSRVFGAGRRPGSECWVGSVKPNIGHLEAGAGMAGVIKTVLSLQRGQIPKSLFDSLTDVIDWSTSGIRVVPELMAWPSQPGPKRAGVSCFGVGGTISHVIIEAPPETEPSPRRVPPATLTTLFPLSGHSPENVANSAAKLADWLQRHPAAELRDVGYTLARRREALPVRHAVIAAERAELIEALHQLAQAPQSDEPRMDQDLTVEARGVVFVFSGHGAQWQGMCRELLDSKPVFAAEIDALADVYVDELGYSPREALRQGEFTTVARIQAMTFALQVALAALWESQGLTPAAVIGYSIGEIAAAVVAGALDKQSAARFACRRAACYQRLSGLGGMLLVNIPFAEAEQRLADTPGVVASIFASPASCVISGDAEQLERILIEWASEDIVPRRVATDVAFHSPHIDAVIDEIGSAASELRPLSPRIPMFNSTLDDPRADAVRGSAFWRANSRNPVRFEQAVGAALADGFAHYLEVSTKPIVSHSLEETAEMLGYEAVLVCPTLREGRPERREIVNGLATFYRQGVALDWRKLYTEGQRLDLPTMGWRHRRYWTQAKPMRGEIGAGHDPRSHSLLGSHRRVSTVPVSDVWHSWLTLDSRPYPGRHPICGIEIMPAAILLQTFIQAGTIDRRLPTLHNVALRTPVAVEGEREIQVVRQGNALTLSSRLSDGTQEETFAWLTHTTATLSWAEKPAAMGQNLEHGVERCPEVLIWSAVEPMYQRRGIAGYGLAWNLQTLRRGAGELIATMSCDAANGQQNSWAVVLDAVLTVIPLLLADDDVLRMPMSIASLSVSSAVPASFSILARHVADAGTEETQAIDIDVLNEQGEVALQLRRLVFGAVDRIGELPSQRGATVFVEAWEPCALNETALNALPNILLLGDDDELMRQLAANLRQNGADSLSIAEEGDFLPAEDATLVLVIGALRRAGETLAENAERNAWRLLSAVQRVAMLAPDRPALRIGCVTADVRSGRNEDALGQAVWWGMARVIAGEHPAVWAGMFDVEPQALQHANLLAHLRDGIGYRDEDVISIGVNSTEALRLKALATGASAALPNGQCQPDATYVVTGGLGTLGLLAAQHLFNQGARRLVLVGRRGLPHRELWPSVADPEIRRMIDGVLALEQQGAMVRPLAVDIADEQAVACCFAELSRDLPPVRGVVHAAGTFSGGMSARYARDALRETLRAKVGGAMVLDKLFSPGTLDFFILFSSSGSYARLSGQVGYAAANAFMDRFAYCRALRDGNRTRSIGWMAWEKLGMSRHIEASMCEARAQGVDSLHVSEALEAWQVVMASETPYAAVFRTNESTLAGSALPVLSRLMGEEAPAVSDETATAPWGSVPDAEIAAWFVDDVRALIAMELRCMPDEINPRRPLMDKGVDSLITVALRLRLKKRYQIEVPATLLWNHPTVIAIAGFVQQAMGR